jgi:5,5'-dehydrodivanillate O-demethylase
MTTARDRDHLDHFAPQRCGADALAGQYLRHFWHPVALAESVRAGRARPARALGESFTLYRGAGGRIYAIGAACAHRCTTLAIGTVEGESLRCLYHGGS